MKPLILLAFILCSAESCQQGNPTTAQHNLKAPEISASGSIAGLTLLLGAIAIILGRRK